MILEKCLWRNRIRIKTWPALKWPKGRKSTCLIIGKIFGSIANENNAQNTPVTPPRTPWG